MAITVATPQPYKHGWIANGNSADLSGGEELKAAPGTGLSLYLEELDISSGAAITITIGAGETAGAVTTVIVGPIYFAANTTHKITFRRPVQLAADTALVVDASGAWNATVLAQGFTQ